MLYRFSSCGRLLKTVHEVVAIDNLSTGTLDNLKTVVDNPKFRCVCDNVSNSEIMHVLIEQCDMVFTWQQQLVCK